MIPRENEQIVYFEYTFLIIKSEENTKIYFNSFQTFLFTIEYSNFIKNLPYNEIYSLVTDKKISIEFLINEILNENYLYPRINNNKIYLVEKNNIYEKDYCLSVYIKEINKYYCLFYSRLQKQ